MSRIVIWSPNYAPELTGIPPLVTDAAEWLAARGHEVHVVTAVPNYPERQIHPAFRRVLWRTDVENGVAVHRSWLRVRPEESFTDKALYELSLSSFSLPGLARIVRPGDTVVCLIPTLTAAVYAGAIARLLGSKIRLVLWVQDLVLSAAAAVDGMGPVARRLLRAARSGERFAARAADAIVVCSPGFGAYLAELGAPANRIETILNWADTDWIADVNGSRSNGSTRFLYAGNIGYSQGFETLIEAARLSPPEIVVDIVGAGNASSHLRRLAAGLPNVHVRPPVPRDAFPALLARADAHLVLQRRVVAGANLPSKIATYLASARPLVASLAPETPAAELLRRSGGALIVEPDSPASLADGMLTLHARPDLRAELGARGRAFATRRLSRAAALGRLEAAILG